MEVVELDIGSLRWDVGETNADQMASHNVIGGRQSTEEGEVCTDKINFTNIDLRLLHVSTLKV